MKRISGSQVTVPVPCVSMALTLEGSNCASVSAIKITAWMGIFSLFLGDVRDDNEGILKGSWRTKKWKLQHIKKNTNVTKFRVWELWDEMFISLISYLANILPHAIKEFNAMNLLWILMAKQLNWSRMQSLWGLTGDAVLVFIWLALSQPPLVRDVFKENMFRLSAHPISNLLWRSMWCCLWGTSTILQTPHPQASSFSNAKV